MFWSIILILIAYVVPMVVGFAVSGDLNVFWGSIAFIVNLCFFMIKYEQAPDKSQNVLTNAELVFVLGVVFSVVIFIASSSLAVLLIVVMVIASLIFCAIF